MAGGEGGGRLDQVGGHCLPLEQSVHLTIRVCRGLEHAHSHGVSTETISPPIVTFPHHDLGLFSAENVSSRRVPTA